MTHSKIEMARFIKSNLNQNKLIGMYDSGITSYFSERNFFAMNGLISDFYVAKKIKLGMYNDIIKKYNIEYFVWDIKDEKLDTTLIEIIYKTKIKTVYMDFKEKEKSFVLFRLKNISFEDWLKLRYVK